MDEIDEIVESLFGTRTTMPSCEDYLCETLIHTHLWVLVEAVRVDAQKTYYKGVDGIHDKMLKCAVSGLHQFHGLERVCLLEKQPKHDVECEGLASLFG
jgi:hypothetical protein